MSTVTTPTAPRRHWRPPALAAAGLGLAIVVAACQPPKKVLPPEPPPVEIDHEADGFVPGYQDVYWADGDVLRNPDDSTALDEPLFNVAGAPLDFTWGDYLAVEAESVAVTTRGDATHTTFLVNLEGLVPNGVYSLFYSTFGPDSENPLCPGAVRSLPVPSVDPNQQPDPSSFVADGGGRARYVGRVDGALLDATQVSLQVVYHADGETYHPLPNVGAHETQGEDCRSSFGADAMRQLFILQKWIF